MEAGRGTPLVLLHATPKSSRSYKALIPHLARKHRVIAPDTLGFGASEPLPENVTLSMLGDSVADLIEDLNAKPAMVFGLHTGNKIGAALAVDHPEHVTRFILCGMTHSIIPDQKDRENAIRAVLTNPLTRVDISDDEEVDRENGAKSIDAIYAANYRFDLESNLGSIDVPVLVLELATPEEDRLGRQNENVAALMPYGRALTFHGSDRDALEKYPETLASMILGFTKTVD